MNKGKADDRNNLYSGNIIREFYNNVKYNNPKSYYDLIEIEEGLQFDFEKINVVGEYKIYSKKMCVGPEMIQKYPSSSTASTLSLINKDIDDDNISPLEKKKSDLLILNKDEPEEVYIKTEESSFYDDETNEDSTQGFTQNTTIIDPNVYYLIFARFNSTSNNIDVKFVDNEVEKAKKKNLKPLIVSLNNTAQRDMGISLLMNILKKIAPLKNLDKKQNEDFRENFKKKIVKFFKTLYKKFELDLVTIIGSFCYLSKLVNILNDVVLNYNNIKSVLIACLAISYKVNQEKITKDKDNIYKYSITKKLADFSKITLHSLNKLLDDISEILSYKLFVDPKTYKAFTSFALNCCFDDNNKLEPLKNYILQNN